MKTTAFLAITDQRRSISYYQGSNALTCWFRDKYSNISISIRNFKQWNL